MIGPALCIAVGTALVTLPAREFTLRWQHTVEKVLWEEDYFVVGQWLYLAAARVQGSGAGMEPPEGAVRVGSAWQYRPSDPWFRDIRLARSNVGRDYELCVDGACRPLARWIAAPLGPTTLAPCAQPAGLR